MGKPRELGSPIKRREKGSLVLSNLRKPHLLCKSYRFNDRSEFIQKGHKLGKQWIFTYFFQIEKNVFPKHLNSSGHFFPYLCHNFCLIQNLSQKHNIGMKLVFPWHSQYGSHSMTSYSLGIWWVSNRSQNPFQNAKYGTFVDVSILFPQYHNSKLSDFWDPIDFTLFPHF